MNRDCNTEGHVLVDDDQLHECLACGEPVAKGELVTFTVHREHDELTNPADIAQPGAW